jgi:hypothetical protein
MVLGLREGGRERGRGREREGERERELKFTQDTG